MMQMDKEWRIDFNNRDGDFLPGGMEASSRSLQVSSSPSPSAYGGKCIMHPVSKFDTLAGIAIKYGVEVSDIKRLNGLVSDVQMFALKTLQIPASARHPPSPGLEGNDQDDTHQRPSSYSNGKHSDLFNTFQSLKLKPPQGGKSRNLVRMSSYQDYGLGLPVEQRTAGNGFEMAVYCRGKVTHTEANASFPTSLASKSSLSHPRRSKSITHELMLSTYGDVLDDPQDSESNSDKFMERLVRRRQNSVPEFSFCPPEKLLKQENNNGSAAVSAITGKSLALRSKSGRRTGVDSESSSRLNPIPTSMASGDSFVNGTFHGLRKSPSMPNFQDSENGSLSSLWPTSKWNLKPDFQALSSAGIPIFDGLPKPTGKRNKAAID